MNPLQTSTGYIVKWFIVAVLVGILGGLSALLLNTAIDLFYFIRERYIHYLLGPVIAGIFLGFVFHKIDISTKSFGTNVFINSVNRLNGAIKGRTSLFKLFSSSLNLGFGASGGIEGPMVLIGGSMSNFLLRRIKPIAKYFSNEDMRIGTICGAAGAVGAVFRSPLGGGIFVVELLYKSALHYNELFPAILSSAIGYVTYSLVLDTDPLFTIPSYNMEVQYIPFIVVTAVLTGIISIFFKIVFYGSREFFENSSIPQPLRPAVGGIFTGMTALIAGQEVLGIGTEYVQKFILTSMSIDIILLLLLGKIFATAFTIGSGGSAGKVIPALYIGALAGSLVSSLLSFEFADSALHYSLVVVGMTASLSAIAGVPIASVVMIIEMLGLKMGVSAVIGAVIGYIIGNNQQFYEVTNDQSFRQVCEHFKFLDREVS
ncbi:chloride channel protein [Natranaerobius thermophilus]|uniref:Chloride channel core n=1 Tax=Natranaerobius thermophilus (strain ATCC BAA-1301 / DSM 18059 / JW/NM-WN-LF) TaxID=457570 RepID=B2A6J0_NATTJ|nr:chloride channel protein [Natranaerobius thermophilus]ACB85523.1 Chloride channel core [Natranaerobius thermophilus JW/NM-WN-LF]